MAKDLTGQIVIAAGSPHRGTINNTPADEYIYKAPASNSGIVYIGRSANSISATTCIPLAAGEQIVCEHRPQDLFFDGSESDDICAWMVYGPRTNK